MPSFDVVSELDMHEVTNSVDQANREVGNRFDFKGTNSRLEQKENVITIFSASEFQVQQILDLLYGKLTKRGIDLACASLGDVQTVGKEAKQVVTLRQGIDAPLAKQIVKMIKDSKLKVQAAIQGEQVRISGKQRDDLQAAISFLRQAKIDMPLQFINFRE